MNEIAIGFKVGEGHFCQHKLASRKVTSRMKARIISVKFSNATGVIKEFHFLAVFLYFFVTMSVLSKR